MESEKLPAERVISSILASLLHQAYDFGLQDLVNICKNSLTVQGNDSASSVLSRHEVYALTNKSELIPSKWQPLARSQGSLSKLYINHALRFAPSGMEVSHLVPTVIDTNQDSRRRSLRNSFLGRMSGVFKGETDELQFGDYEEVTNPAILNAPITDICVVQKNEQIPHGYYRLSRTLSGKRANVSTGSGGSTLYLCIKKSDPMGSGLVSSAGSDLMPITTLLVVFADRGEFMPPTYSLVRRDKYPCNFNLGTPGERIFLAYKREKFGNPLTDLQVMLPGSAEAPPPGFMLLDKSPSGQTANLNTGAGGNRVYLCYKQSYRTLQCLKLRDSAVSPNRRQSNSESDFQLHNATLSGDSPNTPRTRATTTYLEDVMSPSTITANRARGGTVDSAITDESAGGGKSVSSSTQLPSELLAAHALAGEDEVITTDIDAALDIVPSSPLSPEENVLDKVNGDEQTEEYDYADEDDELIGSTSYADSSGQGSLTEDLTQDVLGLSGSAEGDRILMYVTNSAGKLRTSAMCEAMYAILMALYVRIPVIAQTSIQGLMLLLKETDMFAGDMHHLPDGRLLTLLHVAIATVCERLEICLDTETRPLMFFLFSVVKASKGILHPANLKKIAYAFTFVLQCQASKVDLSSPEGALPPPQAQPVSMSSLFNDMPPDMNALTAFKEIFRTVFRPVELLDVNDEEVSRRLHYLPQDIGDEDGYYLYENQSESYIVAHETVLELLDTVLDAVERARVTEFAQKVIARLHLTLSQSSYWSQIYAISTHLFAEVHMRNCFMVLCTALKLAWTGVRSWTGQPLLRDINLKLMALQSVIDYLGTAGEVQRSSEVMGFQIRRLVVPCILANVSFALQDHRIFTKIMWIISLLWKNWRSHTHLEFAILVEQFVIPIMNASTPNQIQPIFQTIVIQEVVGWFDQSSLLVEMFVNFDMDHSSMGHWNLFSHLVRTLCGAARKITNDDNGDSQPAQSSVKTPPIGESKYGLGHVDAIASSVTPRMVHIQALEEGQKKCVEFIKNHDPDWYSTNIQNR